MMSLQTLQYLNKQAARTSRRNGTVPVGIESLADLDRMPPFPFPMIGDRRPKGLKLVTQWFVDTSGCGSDDEPALSISQLIAKLRDTWQYHPEYRYALIECGQFQGSLGVFE